MANKNILNELPKLAGNGGTTLPTGWYAPSDGSRTNTAKPVSGIVIPEQGEGYGIQLGNLDGMGTDVGPEVVEIYDDFGITTMEVDRYRWSTQRDKEYLDFVSDVEYENGALKVIIKKNCWLHIEGTAVIIGGALGSGTDTSGVCIRRSDQIAYYGPPIMGTTVTNEPGARGLALGLSSTHFYRAGDLIKIAIMSTYPTEVKPSNFESGAMHCESYFSITRISND